MRLLSPKQRHWLDFLLAMTEKEVKVRYKKAVLGFFWVVLNPLFQMITIGTIFGLFVPIKVDNYFIYLLAGLLPWHFFSLSLSKPPPRIVYARNLIQKAAFPREAIVLSIIFSNLFHFSIALALFVSFLGISAITHSNQSFDILLLSVKGSLLLVAIMWLTTLTSAISLLCSALNVRYRDVNFVVQALLPIWFYATPIIYTISLLSPKIKPLMYLNPLTPIIQLFTYVLANEAISQPIYMIISFGLSLVFTFFCWKFFMNEAKHFDDWI